MTKPTTRQRCSMLVPMLIIPLLTTLTLIAPDAHGDEDVSVAAVESAIEDYVRAKYAGDVQGVQERAHEDIARRTVMDTYWGRPSDEWVRPYTHHVLQFYGTQYNEVRLDDPEDGRCEIEVFDVEEKTASAVVVMEDVVDYLHMILFDGEWVIADSAVIILDEAGDEPPAVTDEDRSEIAQLVEDYCMGFYAVDGDKVQGTCHPILSKRVVERVQGLDFDYLRSITFEEIRILGETFNADGNFDTDDRAEVDVYEIRGNVAAAKLTASVWFDYFHILRVNGEWTIVNIMFEGLARDRWAT